MAKGAKMLQYKDVLNRLETESPGTKQTFYWGFLEKQQREAAQCDHHGGEGPGCPPPCASCSQPTTAEVCSYCKMMARAKTHSTS